MLRVCVFDVTAVIPEHVAKRRSHTKAGGYTELIDFDLNWISPDGSLDNRPLQKLNADFIEGSLKAGKDACPGPKLEQYLKDANFEDVHAEKFIVPVGTWPADKHLVRRDITDDRDMHPNLRDRKKLGPGTISK